jgi:hypothetical protein
LQEIARTGNYMIYIILDADREVTQVAGETTDQAEADTTGGQDPETQNQSQVQEEEGIMTEREDPQGLDLEVRTEGELRGSLTAETKIEVIKRRE